MISHNVLLGWAFSPYPTQWPPLVYICLVVTLIGLRATLSDTSGWRQFVRELCLILPAVLLYFLVRGSVNARQADAVANAKFLIQVERSFGIFVEQDWQEAITKYPAAVTTMNWIYIWAHWPFVAVSAGWLWCRNRAAYRSLRTAILVSGALGLILFALTPVAPPRLMPDAGFVDTVVNQSRSYRVLQPPALTNIYAAFPSLHFGWNLLVGITLVRHSGTRLGRSIGMICPVAMFMAIVLTANHYILDGVAGGAIALVGYAVAQRTGHGSSSVADAKNLSRYPTRTTRQRKRTLVPTHE